VSAPLTSPHGHFPFAEIYLQIWLSPLVTVTPWQKGMGSLMWATGMPKPYRAVKRVAGPRTATADYPVIRAHTFGDTYTQAMVEADKNDQCVQVLVDFPGRVVDMPDGSKVTCEYAEILEAAREEEYSASSVVKRAVSEYRFVFSLTPA